MKDGQRFVQFLGAAGTVTGSMHLVTNAGRQVLLDAGLFQGLKELRLRNWAPRVEDAAGLAAIVLSHAHIDHSGYLPLLVKRGFRGPIFCTPGTAALLKVLLPDSAFLQEEEAERANRYGYTKHTPAEPLYTVEDAEATLALLEERPFGVAFEPAPGFSVRYRRAGHILGAAWIELTLAGTPPRLLVFSGDVGRWDRPILQDPELPSEADLLLLESTYGDREHPPDAAAELGQAIRDGAKRGGAIIVPAFAVGRTQELLWQLDHLVRKGEMPRLPTYVDSPMAIDVTAMYSESKSEHDPDMAALVRAGRDPLRALGVTFTRTQQASRALNNLQGPVIIIAASGMATGGRVLHHLLLRVGDPRTTVLLAGFQAPGTRGEALQNGAATIRIFGHDVPVRAHVDSLDALSAHADRTELLRWAAAIKRPPHATYLVHGEAGAAAALQQSLTQRLRWTVRIARHEELVSLDW
jgi:metallo-beta-lactamase family protein